MMSDRKLAVPVILTLLMAGLILNSLPSRTWARSTPSISFKENRFSGMELAIAPIQFTPPAPSLFEDTGRPTDELPPAGTRGPCSGQLTALVPGGEQNVAQGEACIPDSSRTLTLAEFPTFWFYVPEQTRSGIPAELALLDENRRLIAREQITLTGESGIIGVRLSQPLATNQSYRWNFTLFSVDPQRPSKNPMVEGFIRRIEPNNYPELSGLSNQLEAATPEQQITLYITNGIWHDALTTLAELHRANPNSSWAELLNSVGLGAIADAPLLNCCSSQPVSN
jgi:hypothetical protein